MNLTDLESDMMTGYLVFLFLLFVGFLAYMVWRSLFR